MSAKRPRSSSTALKAREERKTDQPRRASSVKPEHGRASLELVPELVDKRDYDPKNTNPNFLHAGSLYIPKNIVEMVTSNTPLTSPGNVFPSRAERESNDDEAIEVKDPDLRRYIQRIVRYSGYNPEGAVNTVRKASYEIKQQARISIQAAKRENEIEIVIPRVKEGSDEQLEVWKNSIVYDRDETDSTSGTEDEGKALVPVQQSPRTSPNKTLTLKIDISMRHQFANFPERRISRTGHFVIKKHDQQEILHSYETMNTNSKLNLSTNQPPPTSDVHSLKSQNDFFNLLSPLSRGSQQMNSDTPRITTEMTNNILSLLNIFPNRRKYVEKSYEKNNCGLPLLMKNIADFYTNTDSLYNDSIKTIFYGIIVNCLKDSLAKKCKCKRRSLLSRTLSQDFSSNYPYLENESKKSRVISQDFPSSYKCPEYEPKIQRFKYRTMSEDFSSNDQYPENEPQLEYPPERKTTVTITGSDNCVNPTLCQCDPTKSKTHKKKKSKCCMSKKKKEHHVENDQPESSTSRTSRRSSRSTKTAEKNKRRKSQNSNQLSPERDDEWRTSSEPDSMSMVSESSFHEDEEMERKRSPSNRLFKRAKALLYAKKKKTSGIEEDMEHYDTCCCPTPSGKIPNHKECSKNVQFDKPESKKMEKSKKKGCCKKRKKEHSSTKKRQSSMSTESSIGDIYHCPRSSSLSDQTLYEPKASKSSQLLGPSLRPLHPCSDSFQPYGKEQFEEIEIGVNCGGGSMSGVSQSTYQTSFKQSKRHLSFSTKSLLIRVNGKSQGKRMCNSNEFFAYQMNKESCNKNPYGTNPDTEIVTIYDRISEEQKLSMKEEPCSSPPDNSITAQYNMGMNTSISYLKLLNHKRKKKNKDIKKKAFNQLFLEIDNTQKVVSFPACLSKINAGESSKSSFLDEKKYSKKYEAIQKARSNIKKRTVPPNIAKKRNINIQGLSFLSYNKNRNESVINSRRQNRDTQNDHTNIKQSKFIYSQSSIRNKEADQCIQNYWTAGGNDSDCNTCKEEAERLKTMIMKQAKETKSFVGSFVNLKHLSQVETLSTTPTSPYDCNNGESINVSVVCNNTNCKNLFPNDYETQSTTSSKSKRTSKSSRKKSSMKKSSKNSSKSCNFESCKNSITPYARETIDSMQPSIKDSKSEVSVGERISFRTTGISRSRSEDLSCLGLSGGRPRHSLSEKCKESDLTLKNLIISDKTLPAIVSIKNVEKLVICSPNSQNVDKLGITVNTDSKTKCALNENELSQKLSTAIQDEYHKALGAPIHVQVQTDDMQTNLICYKDMCDTRSGRPTLRFSDDFSNDEVLAYRRSLRSSSKSRANGRSTLLGQDYPDENELGYRSLRSSNRTHVSDRDTLIGDNYQDENELGSRSLRSSSRTQVSGRDTLIGDDYPDENELGSRSLRSSSRTQVSGRDTIIGDDYPDENELGSRSVRSSRGTAGVSERGTLTGDDYPDENELGCRSQRSRSRSRESGKGTLIGDDFSDENELGSRSLKSSRRTGGTSGKGTLIGDDYPDENELGIRSLRSSRRTGGTSGRGTLIGDDYPDENKLGSRSLRSSIRTRLASGRGTLVGEDKPAENESGSRSLRSSIRTRGASGGGTLIGEDYPDENELGYRSQRSRSRSQENGKGTLIGEDYSDENELGNRSLRSSRRTRGASGMGTLIGDDYPDENELGYKSLRSSSRTQVSGSGKGILIGGDYPDKNKLGCSFQRSKSRSRESAKGTLIGDYYSDEKELGNTGQRSRSRSRDSGKGTLTGDNCACEIELGFRSLRSGSRTQASGSGKDTLIGDDYPGENKLGYRSLRSSSRSQASGRGTSFGDDSQDENELGYRSLRYRNKSHASVRGTVLGDDFPDDIEISSSAPRISNRSQASGRSTLTYRDEFTEISRNPINVKIQTDDMYKHFECYENTRKSNLSGRGRRFSIVGGSNTLDIVFPDNDELNRTNQCIGSGPCRITTAFPDMASYSSQRNSSRNHATVKSTLEDNYTLRYSDNCNKPIHADVQTEDTFKKISLPTRSHQSQNTTRSHQSQNTTRSHPSQNTTRSLENICRSNSQLSITVTFLNRDNCKDGINKKIASQQASKDYIDESNSFQISDKSTKAGGCSSQRNRGTSAINLVKMNSLQNLERIRKSTQEGLKSSSTIDFNLRDSVFNEYSVNTLQVGVQTDYVNRRLIHDEGKISNLKNSFQNTPFSSYSLLEPEMNENNETINKIMVGKEKSIQGQKAPVIKQSQLSNIPAALRSCYINEKNTLIYTSDGNEEEKRKDGLQFPVNANENDPDVKSKLCYKNEVSDQKKNIPLNEKMISKKSSNAIKQRKGSHLSKQRESIDNGKLPANDNGASCIDQLQLDDQEENLPEKVYIDIHENTSVKRYVCFDRRNTDPLDYRRSQRGSSQSCSDEEYDRSQSKNNRSNLSNRDNRRTQRGSSQSNLDEKFDRRNQRVHKRINLDEEYDDSQSHSESNLSNLGEEYDFRSQRESKKSDPDDRGSLKDGNTSNLIDRDDRILSQRESSRSNPCYKRSYSLTGSSQCNLGGGYERRSPRETSRSNSCERSQSQKVGSQSHLGEVFEKGSPRESSRNNLSGRRSQRESNKGNLSERSDRRSSRGSTQNNFSDRDDRGSQRKTSQNNLFEGDQIKNQIGYTKGCPSGKDELRNSKYYSEDVHIRERSCSQLSKVDMSNEENISVRGSERDLSGEQTYIDVKSRRYIISSDRNLCEREPIRRNIECSGYNNSKTNLSEYNNDYSPNERIGERVRWRSTISERSVSFNSDCDRKSSRTGNASQRSTVSERDFSLKGSHLTQGNIRNCSFIDENRRSTHSSNSVRGSLTRKGKLSNNSSEIPIQINVEDDMAKKRYVYCEIVDGAIVLPHVLGSIRNSELEVSKDDNPSFNKDECEFRFCQKTNITRTSNEANLKNASIQHFGSQDQSTSVEDDGSQNQMSCPKSIGETNTPKFLVLNISKGKKTFKNLTRQEKCCSKRNHKHKDINLPNDAEELIKKLVCQDNQKRSYQYRLAHESHNPFIQQNKIDIFQNYIKSICKKLSEDKNSPGEASQTFCLGDIPFQKSKSESIEVVPNKPIHKKKTVIWKCKCPVVKGQNGESPSRTVKDGANSNKKGDTSNKKHKASVSGYFQQSPECKNIYGRKTMKNILDEIKRNPAQTKSFKNEPKEESAIVYSILLPQADEKRFKKVTFIDEPKRCQIQGKINDHKANCSFQTLKRFCVTHPSQANFNYEPYIQFLCNSRLEQNNKFKKIQEKILEKKPYKIEKRPVNLIYYLNSKKFGPVIKKRIKNEQIFEVYKTSSEDDYFEFHTQFFRRHAPFIPHNLKRRIMGRLQPPVQESTASQSSELRISDYDEQDSLNRKQSPSKSNRNICISSKHHDGCHTKTDKRNRPLQLSKHSSKQHVISEVESIDLTRQKNYILENETVYKSTSKSISCGKEYVECKNAHCLQKSNYNRCYKYKDTATCTPPLTQRESNNRIVSDELNCSLLSGRETNIQGIGEKINLNSSSSNGQNQVRAQFEQTFIRENLESVCERKGENLRTEIKLNSSSKEKYAQTYDTNRQNVASIQTNFQEKGTITLKQGSAGRINFQNNYEVQRVAIEPRNPILDTIEKPKRETNSPGPSNSEAKRETIKFSGSLIFEGEMSKSNITCSLGSSIIQQTVANLIKKDDVCIPETIPDFLKPQETNKMQDQERLDLANSSILYPVNVQLESSNTSNECSFPVKGCCLVSNQEITLISAESLGEQEYLEKNEEYSNSHICVVEHDGSPDSGSNSYYIYSTLGVSSFQEYQESEINTDSSNDDIIRNEFGKKNKKAGKKGKQCKNENPYLEEKLMSSSSSDLVDSSKSSIEKSSNLKTNPRNS